MTDRKEVNGIGETKKSSCEDKSPVLISADHSPKFSSEDDASPKAASFEKSPCQEKLLEVSDKDKALTECTPEKDEPLKTFEDIFCKAGESSESCAEDIFEKDVSSSELYGDDTPEKEESFSTSESFGTPKKEEYSTESVGTPEKRSESLVKGSPGKDKPLWVMKTVSAKSASISKEDIPVQGMSKVLTSPEKRRPRINRRSLHENEAFLAQLDNPKLGPETSFAKQGAFKRRIVSLSSVKKTTSEEAPVDKEQKKTALKRKLSSSSEEEKAPVDKKKEQKKTVLKHKQSCVAEEKKKPRKDDDADTPPKKKFKPIVWP